MSKFVAVPESSSADAQDLYRQAVFIVRKYQLGSVALIQRRLKLGHSEALRLMAAMVAAGVVSEEVAEDGYRQIL
ncbi:MAG: DNA translocase FtsK [Rhodoferax sp.]|nr:DNA translocase FtsK [Rhodoferax sp.]